MMGFYYKTFPLLIILHTVTSTPYGYGGVKTGAVAHSSAVAGAGAYAFPGVPVPNGGGYGSYANSGAASYASSSAGSFSYGGSGGNDAIMFPMGTGAVAGAGAFSGGYAGYGGSGCKSGNCGGNLGGCSGSSCGGNPKPSIGCSNGNCGSSSHINSEQNYDDSQDGDYSDNDYDCASGNCGPSPQANFNKPNGCTSGNCGSESPYQEPYQPTPQSNKPVKTGYSHVIVYPSPIQPYAKKGCTGNSCNGCSSGNCNFGSPNPSPIDYAESDLIINQPVKQYQPIVGTSSCNGPECGNRQPPNKSSCSQGNCGHQINSYNSPSITGSNQKPCSGPDCNQSKLPNKPGCVTGNCDFTQTHSNSYDSSNNYEENPKPVEPVNAKSKPNVNVPPNSPSCQDGNCDQKQGPPSSYDTPLGSVVDKEIPTSEDMDSIIPLSTNPACKNGNCDVSQPTTNSNDSPQYPEISKEKPNIKSSSCSGPGCISSSYPDSPAINENENPEIASNYQSKLPISSCQGGSCKNSKTPCKTGNCGIPQSPNNNYGSPISSVANAQAPISSSYPDEPKCKSGNCENLEIASNYQSNIPTTSCQGVSCGNSKTPCKNGNCGIPQSPSNNNEPPISSVANDQAPISSSYPDEPKCKSGNCENPEIASNYQSNIPTTSCQGASCGNSKTPCKTGNCGIPQYPLNSYDTPLSSVADAQAPITPSDSYNTPTEFCNGPNCKPSSYPDEPNCKSGNCQPGTLPSGPGDHHETPANQENNGNTFSSISCSGSECGKPVPVSKPTCKGGNCGYSHDSFQTSNAAASSATLGGNYGSIQATKISCTGSGCTKSVQNLDYAPKCSGPSCKTPSSSSNSSPCNGPNCGSESPNENNQPEGEYEISNYECTGPSCSKSGIAGSLSGTGSYVGVGSSVSTGNYGNPNQTPLNHYTVTSGKKHYTGSFGGAPGILSPNDFTVPSKHPQPNYPTQNPIPTQSVTIPPQPIPIAHPQPTHPPQSQGINDGLYVISPGAQVSQSNVPTESNINNHNQVSVGAGAVAASGVYTGSFGGPPGVLAPYDNVGGKHPNIHHQTSISLQHGTSSSPKKPYTGGFGGAPGIISATGPGYGSGAISGSGAFAGASAYAGAGSSVSNNYPSYEPIQKTSENKGCAGECHDYGYSSSGGVPFEGAFTKTAGLNIHLAKEGILNGIVNGINTAGAVAKSVASSVSHAGAGSYGLSGSYAGSSASAGAVASSSASAGAVAGSGGYGHGSYGK